MPTDRALNERERAELQALRDNQQRLIAFDGGAELMPWVAAHKHHAEEPYIGCVFCRDKFVLRSEVAARGGTEDELREALNRIERGSREAANNAPSPWAVVFELAATTAAGALRPYERIGQEVSRRHPGCIFTAEEVRALADDPSESTGVPQADDEIRAALAARAASTPGPSEAQIDRAAERVEAYAVEMERFGGLAAASAHGIARAVLGAGAASTPEPRPERWMVDYEHGEGEPQHAVLSWLDDEAHGLPEVGTYLRESDAGRAASTGDRQEP